jgi:hypothetical protein
MGSDGLVLAAGSLFVSKFVYTPTGVKRPSWRGGADYGSLADSGGSPP